ncbi:MAG: DUF512 domain-containing protein [Clostridia bacterium]|nr:DUF512 domain-containing protein [Clostridia bacterium]
MVTVSGIEKGSDAEKLGVLPGDRLLSIDGHPIRDVLDYRFYLTEPEILLRFQRGESVYEKKLKKRRYDDIGLDFDTFLMDRKKSCANRCIFCFIDQNPCGMRETIYFKDDDTRLSFLMGNYVTLTNVSDEELSRIVKMRLSPVNVSVHTTSPELRVKMLGNPKAGRIMEQLRILTEGGIDVNCQIVSCPGINDGEELVRTVRDLETLFPAVQSIAVVPAGLTRHREGLYPLEVYRRESAEKVLSIVDRFQAEYLEKYDWRYVYAADEFYLAAGRELPREEAYDGYPQLDNGVGLIRSAREEILAELEERVAGGSWEKLPKNPVRITLCTGVAAEAFLREIADAIHEKLPQVTFTVEAVKNRFFGETVTVAGLLCGQDIIDAFKDKKPDVLFIPAVALRHERDKFLDDVTFETVQNAIGGKVLAVENGTAILDAVEQILQEEEALCQNP